MHSFVPLSRHHYHDAPRSTHHAPSDPSLTTRTITNTTHHSRRTDRSCHLLPPRPRSGHGAIHPAECLALHTSASVSKVRIYPSPSPSPSPQPPPPFPGHERNMCVMDRPTNAHHSHTTYHPPRSLPSRLRLSRLVLRLPSPSMMVLPTHSSASEQ